MSTSFRFDRLVGREVHTANNRRLGRVEEFRAERHGEAWFISEYVIGTAGLLERLGLGVRLILGSGCGRVRGPLGPTRLARPRPSAVSPVPFRNCATSDVSAYPLVKSGRTCEGIVYPRNGTCRNLSRLSQHREAESHDG